MIALSSLKNEEYDPDGNRLWKSRTISGQTTKRKYILDSVGSLPVVLLELDPQDNMSISKTYIYGNSQILTQHDGNDSAPRYFYLHDRLGNVRQVIDSSASVVNCYTYDPWGLPVGDETNETVSNPYRFAGYVWDDEVSQYHCFRRQYEPLWRLLVLAVLDLWIIMERERRRLHRRGLRSPGICWCPEV
jgi:uncharacterized protein RhaS with RHS repeats